MFSFQFSLDRQSGVPLYKQLAEMLKNDITSGRLPEGAKLPSQRELAGLLGVSRSVIAFAYDQLAMAGLIKRRTGRGSYAKRIHQMDEDSTDYGTWTRESDSWSRNLRLLNYYKYHRNNRTKKLVSFDWCFPRVGEFPAETIKNLIRNTSEEEIAEFLAAREIRGSKNLLGVLTTRLKACGERITEKNLFVSSGFLESLFMLFLVMTRPGDRVIMENPTCSKAIKLARFFDLEIFPIPRTRDGMNMNILEETLKRIPVKFILTMTRSHNPMGSNIPENLKELLARLSAEYRTPLIDLAMGAMIQYDNNSPKPLRYYDLGDTVIEVYDMALCIAPGVDVGWIVAPQNIVEGLFCTDYSLNMDGAGLNELVAYKMISTGLIDRQIKEYTRLFSQKRDTMTHACARLLPSYVRLNIPDGGVFFWLELPKGFNTWRLLEIAFKKRLIFMPGSESFIGPVGETFVRLSLAGMDDEKIFPGVKLLSRVLEQFRKEHLSGIHSFEYDNGI